MNKINRTVRISGKRIDLCVHHVLRHLKNCLIWANDEKIIEFLTIGFFPLSELTERKWLERKLSDTDITLAIETKNGIHIGNIGLHNIDWKNRKAELGIMIGNRNYWGKGIASEAEALMIAHGFNIGMNKITIKALSENIGSTKAALKNKLFFEGCQRNDVYKNGKFYDVNIYSILRSEWDEYNK